MLTGVFDPLGVDGDTRHEGVLRDAGIDRAATLVAAIDDSNVNVRIALLATQLAPDPTVIVRVGDETFESVARHAGADDVHFRRRRRETRLGAVMIGRVSSESRRRAGRALDG